MNAESISAELQEQVHLICGFTHLITGTKTAGNQTSFDQEEDYPEEKYISNYMKSLYAESDYANTIEYAEKGMDIEMICEITGLTPDEVNTLK